MGEPRAEPTNSQGHDPGGETTEPPPLAAPVFPERPSQQQERPQVQNNELLRPPPGGLTRSPEELTRQVGWSALTEAVTKSATALYPNDPQAVAITVANSLQPYMLAFAPRGLTGFTSGTAGPGVQGQTTTPLSKTTESIVLGAITGNKSHEVAKYQHTFPHFPGGRCRDDIELWENTGKVCTDSRR